MTARALRRSVRGVNLRPLRLAVLLPALLLACADAAPGDAPDAAPEDAAPEDAAPEDIAPEDAAPEDITVAPDAPGEDAGPEDVAVALDAPTDEAATADAASADAARDAITDARADAGPATDAAVPPDAPPPPPSAGYDVFLLAGQSNMVGRGSPFSATLDATDSMAFQWGRFGANNGRIIPATARLEHNDSARLDRVGLGLSFAKAYLQATGRARRVLLVPTARGGTGFAANEWNPGDALFEDAVARANAAMRSHPDNRFLGILWHQGEADVGRLSTAAYAAALDRLIYRFRGRITGAATAPVVVGEFCPDWRPTGSAAAVTTALRATPMRVPFAAVAPAMGLRGNAGDTIHFDAAAMRAYGPRYATARVSALANAPTAAPPGAVTALAATPSATSVTLTWQAPTAPTGAPVLGYRVALRRVAAAAWTEQYVTAARATFSTLTPSTAYEASVVAHNLAGLGPAATTRTTTPAR